MRVRTKLLLLFLSSGAFLLVEGLAAAWGLREVGRDVDRLQRYTQTDDLCGQIKAELARLPRPELLGTEPGRARTLLLEHSDRATVLCRSLERLTFTPSSRDAVGRIVRALQAYRTAGREHADAQEAELARRAGGSGDGDRPPGDEPPSDERAGFPEQDAAAAAWDGILAVQDGVIEPVGHEARLATQAVVNRADTLNTWVTLGGLGLALVLTVVTAIVLARVTAQPLVKLVRGAREVGRGKLDTVVEIRTNDELGELAHAFNDMTARLRRVYAGLEAEIESRTAELRRREVELERARRLAAVGRLAAGVAHEVSNPLAVIAGAAEGLRDRARDPVLAATPGFSDFPEYLEQIESEAYRLKKVIRRLLDFSRTKPTALTDVDVAEVLSDAVSLARLDPRARAHPIHCAVPERPLVVSGDADALKEAVLNLLFNALDAVAQGGEVRTSARHDGDRAEVVVEDTGVGIKPVDLERLFEPFFSTKGADGTGLGLALVYGAMERHGGTISATSDGPGKGARFTLRLPLAG